MAGWAVLAFAAGLAAGAWAASRWIRAGHKLEDLRRQARDEHDNDDGDGGGQEGRPS